jgi:predicted kinase
MKSLQLEKPHAVVTIGIQGSGKSFFAKKFADTFNAPFLDESLFIHSTKDSSTANELQRTILSEMLKTGRSIVIEQSFSTRSERTELTSVLRKAGYVPLYVWVQVDTDTAFSRSTRLTGISAEDYKASMRKFSPPHPTEKPLVISGKHTFATQAKAVLKKLSVPRALPPSPERKQPTRGQIFIR